MPMTKDEVTTGGSLALRAPLLMRNYIHRMD